MQYSVPRDLNSARVKNKEGFHRTINNNPQLVVMTDASDYGAGSVLLQRVGFYSRKFSTVERGMPTYFRELTALL